MSVEVSNKIGFFNEELVIIISSTLEKGASTRMKALGCSMYPFIKGGDIVTVSPLFIAPIGIGKVAAFTCPQKKRLTVHRAVKQDGNCFLFKGDSCSDYDGWISKGDILGVITKIERDNHAVHFGLGKERYLISYLSKAKLLPRIYLLLMFIPKKIQRFIKCLINT